MVSQLGVVRHGEDNSSDTEKATSSSSSRIHNHDGFIDVIEKLFSAPPEDQENANEDHRRSPKVLLHHCNTPREHFEKIDVFLAKVKDRHGIDGLRIGGFDYVSCSESDNSDIDKNEDGVIANANLLKTNASGECQTKLFHIESKTFVSMSNRQTFVADGAMYEEVVRLCQEYVHSIMINECNLRWIDVCTDKSKGNPIKILFSNEEMPCGSVGTGEERDLPEDDDISTSIVDEDCQLSFDDDEDGAKEPEFAAEKRDESINVSPSDDDNLSSDDEDDGVSLAEEEGDGQLQQTSVRNERHPATTLIGDKTNNVGDKKKCLIIMTSKGKVRAGIFSRQHLLVSSIECSTALPMVRDAFRRGMKVALLDTNARGERNGTATYEQSMHFLFGNNKTHVVADSNGNISKEQQEGETKHHPGFLKKESLYVLAHSVSGSQLANYLMEEGGHITTRINSLVFTDSTHNVKWFEKKKEHAHISHLFQSPTSLYVRSSNKSRDENWEKHQPGDMCETDQYWKHRFGIVKTIWAGTEHHSLTNWTARSQIWNHFDSSKSTTAST